MEWFLIAIVCLLIYFLFIKGLFWKIIVWIFAFAGLYQFLSESIPALQNNIIWLGPSDSKLGLSWAATISCILVTLAFKIFTNKTRGLDDD